MSLSSEGSVFTLNTPDQATAARIDAWDLRLGSGVQREYRAYSYDGSSNVTSIATSVSGSPSSAYTYDMRSRLTKSVDTATEYRWFDSFGNLWKIENSVSGIQNFTPEQSTNRHIATGSGVSAAFDANRGTLVFDSLSSRNIGRDYYADGRPMSEYRRTSGSYGTVSPDGISAYLVDGRGERVLTFHGDGVSCGSELFRHSIRDESGRILTDYNAESNGRCDCGNPACQWWDRYERDYVWLGNYTLATIARGEGAKFAALDHLGSPRRQFDAQGTEISQGMLDAWGQENSVTMAERTRFTGHERNHVNLDGTSLQISDYMHARTYVPMLGRFTSPDVKRSFSLFSPGEMNRYAYANVNPAKNIDPNGREFLAATEKDRAYFAAAIARGTSNSLARELFLRLAASSQQFMLQTGRLADKNRDTKSYGDTSFRAPFSPDAFGGVKVGGPMTITVDDSKFRSGRFPTPTITVFHEFLHSEILSELGTGFNAGLSDVNKVDRQGRPLDLGFFDALAFAMTSSPDSPLDALTNDEVSRLIKVQTPGGGGRAASPFDGTGFCAASNQCY